MNDEKLHRIVHPNRGMLYFLAISIAILLGVYYAAQLYVIDEEARDVEASFINTQSVKNTDALREENIQNWKTYRNKEYGFEFKYPPSYRTPIEESRWISFQSTYSIYPEDNRLNIGVDDYLNKNLDQVMQELKKEESTPRLSHGGSGVAYYNIEKYVVGGKEGLKFDAHYEGGFYSTNVYVVYNQRLYKIFYNTDTNGSSAEELKTILSTLTFFEPKP
ncbi:MAG: hypothetical protein A3F26_02170 [Candidatus Ryanbacteria bacterium RIFCSPHIGHO2_12_FULL_47_12b]|nr:MAG: hypothetical protein A2844_01975 [Candidatus Ryanbacteria bacterium RIFCSPHIGHO2_01_FULL_48_80]OGZ51307.1 MAG: hypothetical protein A3F26_02170 [Candidatus Ryanbacteria bacterium RIFCSPHIGHO2_12_FULL_47_12b]OGZ52233.1 MAG: hypothetical protein A3A29_02980 [Candidatus Ryanbacteria bacterium RIFCSPLOWO2_01_FULL_47_79]